jgi:acetyltransferase-like isoleucine patch superfamily enzyme
VHDSILGPNVDVGARATVEGLSVLGEGTAVAAGEVVRGERRGKDDA